MTIEHFNVAGAEYSFSKLPVLQQAHILRRLTPLLSDIAPVLKAGDKDNAFDILGAAVGAISKLNDADFEYVFFGLLSAVSRKQTGGGWAQVTPVGGKVMMFDDIDLPSALQLAGRALMHNLGNFSNVLPSALKEGSQRVRNTK
jgi:hypothetical protein